MWLYHFFPRTTDVSAPYIGTGLVGILAAAGVAGYGAATRLPTTPARAGAKPRCSERASSRR